MDEPETGKERPDVPAAQDGGGAAAAAGETLETVSCSLGVTAATPAAWRDAFLAVGEAAPVTRPESGEAMSGAVSPVTGRCYGLAALCHARRVSRAGAPRGPRSHDGTIIPAAIDTMWGADLTTTIIGEGQVAMFIAVDHFTAECVGIHADHHATRFARWSRSATTCVRVSTASPRTSRAASACALTTARRTGRTPSRATCAFSASTARRRFSVLPRAVAAPDASSAR